MRRTSPEVAVALGKSIQAYDEKLRRLAAAAPEMLEALRLCVARDPSLKSNAMVMDAIAKAEGR